MKLTILSPGAFARFWSLLSVGMLLVVLSVAHPACTAAANRRAAVTTIVGTGATAVLVFDAHLSVYRETAARTRSRVNADPQYRSGTERIVAYDREMAAVDRAFDERTRALQTLSVALYSAAAIIDVAGNSADGGSLAQAAATTLEVLLRTLDDLRQGDGPLSAVQIPSAVESTLAALRLVAGSAMPSVPTRTMTIQPDARTLVDATLEY